MKKIVSLIKKYKEIILYIIFGGLTTLVNFVAFGICNYLLGQKLYLFNNAIAWIVSVIFAYLTNKIFVFQSKNASIKVLLKEGIAFLGARVFSFLIEEFFMWLFIDMFGFGTYSVTVADITITGQIITKILLAVIVVILNYFFSKFFIFTTKKES